MNNKPVISPAEWKIMRLLWAKSPQPAYDLVEALAKPEGWHGNTIRTMLSRLYLKKAVGITKYKNLFLYHPLVSEEECVAAESDSFLQQVFGGAVKPMLIYFAKREKLTAGDLDELKKLLHDKKR
jgi:BlaI family transcriptional regulator, penicillinase repressor